MTIATEGIDCDKESGVEPFKSVYHPPSDVLSTQPNQLPYQQPNMHTWKYLSKVRTLGEDRDRKRGAPLGRVEMQRREMSWSSHRGRPGLLFQGSSGSEPKWPQAVGSDGDFHC